MLCVRVYNEGTFKLLWWVVMLVMCVYNEGTSKLLLWLVVMFVMCACV